MTTTAAQHLTTILGATAAITNLVGTRYWPDIAPYNAELPRITYQIISEIRHDWINAPGVAKRCRAQVNCWASTRNGADALADAVEHELSLTGRVVFRQSTFDAEAQIYWTQLDWSYVVASP